MKKISHKNKGFTLAEVLITLGIIGVVCAMTIPTLMQNQQEQATVSQLKKFYSTLSSAFTLAVQDNGTPDQWGLTSGGVASKTILDNLATHLKVTKNCGYGTGCFPTDVTYKRLEGGYDSDSTPWDNYTSGSRLQLNDGSIIQLIYTSPASTSDRYAVILVDINGFKNPNQMGVDAFDFIMWQTKIVPAGAPIGGSYFFPGNCNETFNPADTTITRNGAGCAAWVIYNNNMDYRHCSNLQWSGPTKCQ